MALQDIVKKGSVDSSVTIYAFDNTTGLAKVDLAYNSAGIALWYRREGAAQTAITEATLAALTTAHADGGFLAVGDGEYRLDLPDAAFASGANYVDYGGTATGFTLVGGRVRFVGIVLDAAVRGGMTALLNAAADAAGGLPISDAGGLDLDAKVGALTFTVAGKVDSNLTHWLGTAAATPATAGYPVVTHKVGTGTGELSITGGRVAIQSGLQRNVAIADFSFPMTDSTNHNPLPGLTVTAQYSHNGGDTYSSAGTVVEATAADGGYHIDLSGAVMNAPFVLLKFTATGADPLFIALSTDA